MDRAYFFLQPLLDARLFWRSLLFNGNQPLDDETLSHALPLLAKQALIQRMPCVLPLADSTTLSDDLLAVTPPRALLMLPASILDRPDMLDRCRSLTKSGRVLGLRLTPDDMETQLAPDQFAGVSVVAEDFFSSPVFHNGSDHGWGRRLYAENVPSENALETLHLSGFECFDAKYVVRTPLRSNQAEQTARTHLIKLLSMVANDCDTHDLEQEFRSEPTLTYNLLRLVSSAGVGGVALRITSVSQAISVLGRVQLQRWLQLMLFANLSEEGGHSPLMGYAVVRGYIMERLSPLFAGPDVTSCAFLAGMMPLLELVLHQPVKTIMSELALHPAIQEAVLTPQDNPLGQLLGALGPQTEADRERAAETLAGLGITPEAHLQAQCHALKEAMVICNT